MLSSGGCLIQHPDSSHLPGVPLLEVVTEPDMRSGVEAAAYGAELRRVVTFLGISNGNMQVRTGSLWGLLSVLWTRAATEGVVE